MLLFRPILVRFCLPQSASAPAVQGLEDRILQNCATLSVESAQKMITLMWQDSRPGPDATLGVVPWWYRVFYLSIASQHLIAAMLRPDVFRPAVVDHWNKAMEALCAHEHLSPCVSRCISSFRAMWQKVDDIHRPAGDGDQAAPDVFQDIIQHLGFEADDPMFNFGMEDMNWLGPFDWNPLTQSDA